MKKTFLALTVLFCVSGFIEANPDLDVSISKSTLTFAYNGAPQQFTVTATSTWSIPNPGNWCSISPKTGGSGQTIVTITPSQNLGSAARTCRIAVQPKSGTVAYCDVTQGFLLFKISNSLSYTYGGGEQFLTVSADLPWTVAAKSDWLNPMPASGPAGTTVVRVYATGNTSQNARTGEIKLSSGPKTVNIGVSQAAVSTVGSSPKLTVYPNINVTAAATVAYLNTLADECTWTVYDIPSWITLSEFSGSGSRVVTVNISANTVTTGRTATLKFIGSGFRYEQTTYISVKQEGKK